MTRILFVDDERSVLDGLRRSLRRSLKGWDLQFAEGGPEALAVMEASPVDVIVSDMRMPGMDGAELLKQVHARWPDTIRLLLSGYSDSAAIMRSTLVAHQFMAKPCDGEVLRETVRRAIALRTCIDAPEVRTAIGEIDQLPPIPATYRALTRLLGSEDVSLERVAGIVRKDPAVSAKLLQLVNSAFFGLSRDVSDVRDAVSYLGLDVVRDLVLTFGAFAGAEIDAKLEPALNQMASRSLRVAQVAMEIAPKALADAAYSAGLLIDMGQLVIATRLPEIFASVDQRCLETGERRDLAERAVIEADHAAVGAYLLSQWGLPDELTNAIAWHHRPAEIDVESAGLPTWLHVADALVEERASGATRENAAFDLDHLERLDLSASLDEWRTAAGVVLAGIEA